MKKQNITHFNNKGQAHGYWEWYHLEGNIHVRGNIINGQRIGFWECFNEYSNLVYKSFYIL